MSTATCVSVSESRRPWRFIVVGAVLLACLYLPTLATGFDFIDDGNLVYPARPMTLVQRLVRVWARAQKNYEDLGPFRPVLWVHWEAEAELFHGSALAWRIARLLWLMLAAGMFLWLMRELAIRPGAALLAVALAIWNPYRNEIWTSLTLSEGVAMPYALASLICAIRAARSPRPWRWDVASALCVLAALGCKNTFAALVPAQLLLRVAPDGREIWQGVRRHGWRAAVLGITLLLPIGHFLLFRLEWHPGQYEPGAPTWSQLTRMLWGLKGAISLDWMAVGLVLALVVVGVSCHRSVWQVPFHACRTVWNTHRAACIAGLLLLVGGVGIYLPMDAMSGRYTMPAVWGLDLWIAALLSTVAGVVSLPSRRVTYAAVMAGLVVVALTNLGRQEKFAARADLLWQVLDVVERQPEGTIVGWVSGPLLDVEEGIHLNWHLDNRARHDGLVVLLDEQGHRHERSELDAPDAPPDLLVTGDRRPPEAGWCCRREWTRFYWGGKRQYHCYLWQRE